MRSNVLVLSFLFPNQAKPGYGIFVLNRIRALARFCNLKVIAPVQWYPMMRLVRGSISAAGVPHREEIGGLEVHHPRFAVVPRYFKWFDSISFLWSVLGVLRGLRRGGFAFDVVDAHWTYPDIVAAWYVARRHGKKFGVTVRGHEALYREELSVRRWLVAHFLRKADFVVTLSDELRDRVLGLGVDPAKVHTVLNGVDLSRFHLLDRQACRERLGLPKDQRILLSVGRFTEGKGHHELIRALSELPELRDVALYIISGVNPEDDFRSVLVRMVEERQLKNVHLLDKVPHDLLAQWYGAADAFCLATAREGCPNVVLEALACGTPVVVTDVGATSQVVKPGENGLLVDPKRLDTLAGALRDVLNRRWDRAAIAARMTSWGWSRCAEQVNEVFASVIRGSR